MPVSPSISMMSPDLISTVPLPVPTTVGRLYSLQTIAAWHMGPPTSVTQPLIFAKEGAQLGDVVVATRISPSFRSASSSTLFRTWAGPLTIPEEPGEPLITSLG